MVVGLEVGMRAVLHDAAKMSAKDWRVVPLNWNENLFNTKRKLKIAYYEEDGIFTPIPGVQRGLRVKQIEIIWMFINQLNYHRK